MTALNQDHTIERYIYVGTSPTIVTFDERYQYAFIVAPPQADLLYRFSTEDDFTRLSNNLKYTLEIPDDNTQMELMMMSGQGVVKFIASLEFIHDHAAISPPNASSVVLTDLNWAATPNVKDDASPGFVVGVLSGNKLNESISISGIPFTSGQLAMGSGGQVVVGLAGIAGLTDLYFTPVGTHPTAINSPHSSPTVHLVVEPATPPGPDPVEPYFITQPTIIGTAEVGETLTLVAGTYGGDGTITSSLVLQVSSDASNWSTLQNPAPANYLIPGEQEDNYFRLNQSLSSEYGSASTVSAVVGPVAGASPVTDPMGPPPTNDMKVTFFGSSNYVARDGDTDAPLDVPAYVQSAFTSGTALFTNKASNGSSTATTYNNLNGATSDEKNNAIFFAAGGNLSSDDEDYVAAANKYRDAQDILASGHPYFVHETGFRVGPNILSGSAMHREGLMRELERDGRYVLDWQQAYRYGAEAAQMAEWSSDLPVFTQPDEDTVVANDCIPASFKWDSNHGNKKHRDLVVPLMDLPPVLAYNNGAPSIPFGFRLRARNDTALINGGLVGTIPSIGGYEKDKTPMDKWAGTTVSLATPSSNFAVSIVSGELTVTRVGSGRLADAYETLWIKITKTGFATRVYPIEVSLESTGTDKTPRRVQFAPDMGNVDLEQDENNPALGPWLAKRQTGLDPFITPATGKYTIIFDVQFPGSVAFASKQYLMSISGPGWDANTCPFRLRIASKKANLFMSSNIGSTPNITGTSMNSAGSVLVAGNRYIIWTTIDYDVDAKTGLITLGVMRPNGTHSVATMEPGVWEYPRSTAGDFLTLFNGVPSYDLKSNISLWKPFAGIVGGVWAKWGEALDLTDPGVFAEFCGDGMNPSTLTLDSIDGKVLGVTPDLWMPPWFGPGDYHAGRNLGAWGDFITSRRGRLVAV